MTTERECEDPLAETMSTLASGFVKRTLDTAQILDNVTRAAVTLIPGVDIADFLLMDGTEFRSVSPTSPLAMELDSAQQRLNEGPCLEAAVDHSVVRCPDLSDEPRWPRFAAHAVESGVRTMMSFQLYSYHGGTGALNLMGKQPHSITAEGEAIGAMLATHAATALSMDNKQHTFDSALASRDQIGQAKGIIMERFQIGAVPAFELLTKLSQESNTPLRDIAARLVRTVEKPGAAE